MTDLLNKIRNVTSGLRGLGIIAITDVTGNIISALFWFYVAILLGAEQYGQVSYFLSIGSLIATFSLLGSTNTLSVYLPKNIRLESTLYLISIIVGLVAFVVLSFSFSNISLGTYVIGMIFVGLASSEIIASRQYNSYPKYLIISKVLMIGLSIGLYYVIGINGIILGLGLSLFPYLVRIIQGFKNSKINFSLLRPRKEFLINSFILNISSAFKGSIDKLIIAPLVGFTILGNYQFGVQFLAIMTMLPIIVFKYLLPQDARGIPNKKLKTLVILSSVGITTLGIALTPSIIPYFFPDYAKTVTMIQIFSISIIPFTISIILMSEFIGNEKTRVVLCGSGIFIGVIILSIILLGQIFGMNGIAASMLLADSAEAIFYFIIKRIQTKDKTKLT